MVNFCTNKNGIFYLLHNESLHALNMDYARSTILESSGEGYELRGERFGKIALNNLF